MITRTRPVWAEISRSRLIANYRAALAAAREGATPAGSALLAVVKANAYGHGSPQCAPILAEAGAQWLGVTSVDEGIRVRAAATDAGYNPSILVMCGPWQGEAAALLDNQLTPVIWEPYHLDLLEAEAAKRNLPARSIPAASIDVHLEIDTGMSRQGVDPANLPAILQRLQQGPLHLTGVMTHFASAEVADAPLNADQLRRFTQAVEQIAAANLHPQWIHAGNSSTVDVGIELPPLAALAHRHAAQPMPRAGLALYGYCLPIESIGESMGESTSRSSEKSSVSSLTSHLVQQLHPVLTWKTRVVSLREVPPNTPIGYSSTFTAPGKMRLALLPVGYADGYRRELSGTSTTPGGAVLIRGRRAPITGRVSMDLTIVDITDIEGVTIGDEVVLLGAQGTHHIGADEHARLAQTIPYEILCGISDRVPRQVVE